MKWGMNLGKKGGYMERRGEVGNLTQKALREQRHGGLRKQGVSRS